MSQEERSGSSANVISLPQGGGAVAGMGESFSPDLFTGTGNFSVPIAVPPGRNGLQPSLSLGYSTGSGNGTFGLGWNLSLPGISRKTNLGIPRYDDEQDVFVLSGAEDLIPVDRGQELVNGLRHNWTQYRPRTEGLFARIVHHKWNDGQDHWEVRTKDGMITWYGRPGAGAELNTVLYDPQDPTHIASWMIYRTVDPFGNEVLYEYDRVIEQDPYAFAQLYLDRILYADHLHDGVNRHLCSVQLEYDDRDDPHSSFRHGFNIRTTKRCKAIHTFTHPLDNDMPLGHAPSGNNENSILVKTYHLTYRDQIEEAAVNKVSVLSSVQAEGSNDTDTELLPPVEFEYTDLNLDRRDLRFLNDAHLPPLSLGHPELDLVDLNGNGLPDFVQMSAGQPIRFWRNKGNGVFDLPRTMQYAPSGLSLGDAAVQLMDADGDGRVDLVMNAENFAGYYSLDHNGEWDPDSFKRYKTRPAINLQNAQAQFMDLSGDGRTDVLINGERLACYFQNPPLLDPQQNANGLLNQDRTVGWSEARFVNKGYDLDDFPNVDFSDPRIRTADLSGDGLQDVVMIQNGNISYWPNLGYGRFGKRRTMSNSPRLGHGFNPERLLLGDVDGDGLTDVIYVEHNRISIWVNQCGNGFSEPLVITGTPAFSDRDHVRLVDLFGSGTPGLLWSFSAGTQRQRFAFLDLSGGIKPYVMVGMTNNLGARTRVQYRSSVDHYLRDTYKKPLPSSVSLSLPKGAEEEGNAPYDTLGEFVGYAGQWQTSLPFPVQVVDRVEVIDEISKGKLTTRYFYHHGHWDGGEREFRGFGRVDQFDTETFDRYNTDDLIAGQDLNRVDQTHYVPPVLTKNWFHLGPIGAERGDWKELDLSTEFWKGDPNMLQRDPAMERMLQELPRRARRDAFRTLRGTALRSELYAVDGSAHVYRPYTVSESQTGLRLVDSPLLNSTIEALRVETHSNHIFFSYGLSSRSTTWERGNDPMTKFSFSGQIDAYGQPLSQISIAVPRGKDPRTGGELSGHSGVYDLNKGYDATVQFTEFIYVDEDPFSSTGQYMVDRAKMGKGYEALNTTGMNVFELRDLLLSGDPALLKLLGLSYSYYDGDAFVGLPYGELGHYGVPVRSSALMVRPDELEQAFGSSTLAFFQEGADPDWSVPPDDLVNAQQDPHGGYVWQAEGTGPEGFVAGYYASAQMSKFDFHDEPTTAKGLPVAMRDVFNKQASIEYDVYGLLPTRVTDPIGLVTTAEYDYRVMQPDRVTDPNDNVSAFAFTPLGLMHKTALKGKEDGTEGDTLDDPGVLLEYDLFAFMDQGAAVWVRTTQRQHHFHAAYSDELLEDEHNATIVAVEYSDGFGRQLQTRTQAEELVFGDPLLGDSGLPVDQTEPNGPAVGSLISDRVVVSGAKLYNNKGEVVEQWEPFFSTGFELTDVEAQYGQRVRLFYDALGRPQRTVNPDQTQQLVVYGIPAALDSPDVFLPSPWERYSYDANDLAPLFYLNDGSVPQSHHYTPKSELIDALGRTVRTTEHLAHFDSDSGSYQDVVMRYSYDIQGRLLAVTDPLGRVCFSHKYDTAGNNLWTEHLDSGEKILIVDAQGKPLYSSDAKGAEVWSAYDDLHRPTHVWAKDHTNGSRTLRQLMIYGDSSELSDPAALNMNGQLYTSYDEAGKVSIGEYDFKGNPLQKTRWVISDDQLSTAERYTINWLGLDESILDTMAYTSDMEYDGLDRMRKSFYPQDVEGLRKVLVPAYNNAGALEQVKMDDAPFVQHIAYNAKGQRTLMALGNGIMTRYAYDEFNYRLLRIKSEKYELNGDTYDPQSGTTKQDLSYLYDLAGNIVGMNDISPAAVQGPDDLLREFLYDPLNRLLEATGRESSAPSSTPTWDAGIRGHDHTLTNTYTREYDYDQLGNIRSQKHTANDNSGNNFTKTFSYQATQDHNKLLSYAVGSNTYSYTYDANGNLLTENTDRYHAWSFDDKLKLFKIEASGNASKWAHYCYDTAGKRIKKVVNKVGGLQEVVICIDGVFEHSYVRENGAIDSSRHYNTLHILDGNSRVVTQRIGEDSEDATPAIKYNLEDHLGNSSTLLDEYGTLVNREDYYPFGETAFGAFAKKRYRYNGKEKDNESGLYNYGMRYYAPWLCRFVNVDPLAADYPHYTPYQYAGNKPINFIDLDGLEEFNPDEAGGETQFQGQPFPESPSNGQQHSMISTTGDAIAYYEYRDGQWEGIGISVTLDQIEVTEIRKEVIPKPDPAEAINDLATGQVQDIVIGKIEKHANNKAIKMDSEITHHQSSGKWETFTSSKQTRMTNSASVWKRVGKSMGQANILLDLIDVVAVMKDGASPLTLIPGGNLLIAIADEKFNQIDHDHLSKAIEMGYTQTQLMLQPSGSLAKKFPELKFREVDDDGLQKAMGGSISKWYDIPYPAKRQHVILQWTNADDTFNIVTVFMNEFNR